MFHLKHTFRAGAIYLLLGIACAYGLDNRTDAFLAGRYGGIDPAFYCDRNEMEYVEQYGFDWYWLQHQGSIPMIRRNDPSIQRLKNLVGRTRIIYRGWFLGGKDATGKSVVYFDGDERLNGKDWLHLADNEELLNLSLQSIDDQLDLLLKTLGPDSIHAVSIGEEEPHVGMGFGRGIEFFDRNRDENTKKLIRVNNRIYEHLKQRYPRIRVAISYYPDALPEWAYPQFKHDCIAMDSYPNDLASLEKQVGLWRRTYPPDREVYLVLWGAGEARIADGGRIDGYSLLPRDRETAFARTVFDRFRAAGYRNIGFFGLYTHAPVVPSILAWIDELSPGTYRPVSIAAFGSHVAARAMKYQNDFVSLRPYLSETAGTRCSSAWKSLKEAERMRSEAAWRRALSAYNDASLAILKESDATVERIRGALAMRKIVSVLNLPGQLAEGIPDEIALKQLMAKASIIETLADFYGEAGVVLSVIDEKTVDLASAIKTKYGAPAGRLSKDAAARVTGLSERIVSSVRSGESDKALHTAQELMALAAENGLVGGTQLSIILVNPYQKHVNAHPAIAVSPDNKNWTVLYDDEPFHTDTWTLRLTYPVPEETRFVRIVNKHWIGWFNLDTVTLVQGKEKKFPGSWQVQGDVRNPENVLAEDGQYCIIVNNTGGEDSVTFEFAP